LPAELPLALTEDFWNDRAVMLRWAAFVRKNLILPPADDLSATCMVIGQKIAPILEGRSR
jgi:hypothetical protein